MNLVVYRYLWQGIILISLIPVNCNVVGYMTVSGVTCSVRRNSVQLQHCQWIYSAFCSVFFGLTVQVTVMLVLLITCGMINTLCTSFLASFLTTQRQNIQQLRLSVHCAVLLWLSCLTIQTKISFYKSYFCKRGSHVQSSLLLVVIVNVSVCNACCDWLILFLTTQVLL